MHITSTSLISFTSALEPEVQQWKPLIYVISAVAIAILILSVCYYVGFSLKNRVAKNEESSHLDGVEKQESILPLAKPEKQMPPLSFSDLMENSKKFAERIHFPTQENLIENVAVSDALQKEVVEHAKSSQPLLPQRVWDFLPKFLAFKCEHGTEKEKNLYRNMTPEQLVDRFIKKRPLMFMGGADSYKLRDGTMGHGGFEPIGQEDESDDISLADYQSYDEMSLSAFLSMVIPTHFINSGSRQNSGKKGVEGTYEPKGIYVAMVGTRFEKPGLMESRTLLVTKKQNTAENGYGLNVDPANPKTKELRLWAELYGSKIGNTYAFPDFAEAIKDNNDRYLGTPKGLLDTVLFKERMRLSLRSFLYEADKRAAEAGKKAYLHIVGLGLGVWKIHSEQTDLLLEVYAELLEEHCYENISDIDFSWFNGNHCGGVKDQEVIDTKGHEIKVHFSNRDPADKLQGEDEGKLLVAQYAWDSNAYPGNEYWSGMLSASGDPAAACCSTIPELQNPEINPYLSGNNVAVHAEGGIEAS